MAYVFSSNDVSRYVWIGIITKLVRRMVMSVLFKLNDNTIVGVLFNKKFECDFTQAEWNRLEEDEEVYGDDLTYFRNLKEFENSMQDRKWVWATAHSINARARKIEESRYYDRDDYIGDMMYEQAEYLRERARRAVKDSLKLIKG
tara:strand:+ start:55 stop:489 length:435 start_codon:yes stop_codon:yes gene_type:complete